MSGKDRPLGQAVEHRGAGRGPRGRGVWPLAALAGLGRRGLPHTCGRRLLRRRVGGWAGGGVSIKLITGTLLRLSQWIHEVHQLN